MKPARLDRYAVALPLLLGSRSFCFRKRSAKSPLSRNRPKSPKSTRYSPCGVFFRFCSVAGMRRESAKTRRKFPRRKKWSAVLAVLWGRESSPRLASTKFGINWQHEWQRLKDHHQIDSSWPPDASTIFDMFFGKWRYRKRRVLSMFACWGTHGNLGLCSASPKFWKQRRGVFVLAAAFFFAADFLEGGSNFRRNALCRRKPRQCSALTSIWVPGWS